MSLEFKNDTRYQCTITGQSIGTNANTGNPFIGLRIRVQYEITGMDTMEPVARGMERNVSMYITEKTAEFTARDLNTLGFDETHGLDELSPTSSNPFSLVGVIAEFYCKHEDYVTSNGTKKTSEKWSVALPPRDDTAATPLPPSKFRELNALLGIGKKKGAPIVSQPRRTTTPVAPAAAPNAHGTVVTDDDVPF